MKIIIVFSLLIIGTFSYSQNIQHVYMHVNMNGKKTMSDGNLIGIWAYGYYDPNTFQKYNTSMPGPFLNFEVGDSVIVHFWNDSGESHTIHWHGLDVDQANDGVPSTSAAILPFDSTTYHFKTDIKGNYLYHCHIQTSIHLQMGMYGGIRVSDVSNEITPGGPVYINSYNFLSSDLFAYWHPDIVQDYFMINGSESQQISQYDNNNIVCNAETSVALNLFNIGYSITRYIFPEELNTTVYTSDGRALPNSFDTDTLLIYPGERYSALISPIVDIQDSIIVDYLDMYEFALLSSNYILVNINPLGINYSQKRENYLFPNPSATIVNLQLSEENLNKKIYLMDSHGKLADSFTSESNTFTIDTQKYSSGLFLIHLPNKEILKFVIE